MKAYVTTLDNHVIMTAWIGPEEAPERLWNLKLDLSYPYWSEVVDFEEVTGEDDS